MRTYHIFQATSYPDLRGFTDDPRGDMLPAEEVL
jgi:hypothetical protein